MQPITTTSWNPRVATTDEDQSSLVCDARARAYSGVFREHFNAIAGYALRRANPSDAADVVAETFLIAWRRFDDLPPEPDTLPWLIVVARNTLANVSRGERRRSDLGERFAREVQAARRSDGPDFTDASADRMAMEQALDLVDPDDREMLLMSVWEGLTSEEIGAVMDLPPPTVRTRIYRARARLRREIDSRRKDEA